MNFYIELKSNIEPYINNINSGIYPEEILKKADSYVITLFVFMKIFKDVLNSFLDEFSDVLDKLKVSKDDIINSIRIRQEKEVGIIYYSKEMKDKVYEIEFGTPGIKDGTPTTRLFTKFNSFMKIQYDYLIQGMSK